MIESEKFEKELLEEIRLAIKKLHPGSRSKSVDWKIDFPSGVSVYVGLVTASSIYKAEPVPSEVCELLESRITLSDGRVLELDDSLQINTGTPYIELHTGESKTSWRIPFRLKGGAKNG